MNTGMDRSRILRELAVAEESIQVAKEIASPPGNAGRSAASPDVESGFSQ
jgi:hypothetical protein